MNINKDSFDSAYDIFEELGKGHFAVVKRCVNKKTGIELAGKFIRKKRVCRGVPLEDIEREIQTLSCLKHPGIVTLHEVYDTGQTVILLLELVLCGELFDFMTNRECLTEAQTIHIVQQILQAVEHMHSKNIAHLDLKPENVLLLDRTDFPKIKVIDFGLSRHLDKDTEIKTVFGTPEFVAPEVVNFETLSLATDMWAIGVITYILLSGASPFLGEDKQETYSNVVTGTYSFDNEYFQKYSSEAKDFISKLLVKEPKRRNTVAECLEHCWIKMKPQIPDIITTPVSLFEAVEGHDLAALEQVLSRGQVDLNLTNKNGETVLHIAVRSPRIDMTRLLIASGANLGSTDYAGETALIHAARHGQSNQVGLLITAGACITKPNKEGDSALHVASAWGHVDCITTLVENGATVDAINIQGATPLHVALSRKHVNVAMFLLHAAASDYEIQDEGGETSLHIAVREGLLSVVQTLCTLGCNVDQPNKQGLYPIHLAARYGHTEIVRCLCLAGCSTEVKNMDGVKAEITALKHGHVDISALLNKVRDSYSRDALIRQLIPNSQPIPRFNVHLFGHSGVGKSTLVETLKTGYFSSFFRRNKSVPNNNPRSQPNSPSKMHIDMDLTSRRNSLNFDLYNYQYTRGIDVQQVNLSGVGDVTLWDFSGQDTYFCVYHHLMTTSANNAVILLVFNLDDTPSVQQRQCNFWLSFIQSRIPPTEPIGTCGVTSNMPRVIVIATHADSSRTPRTSQGEYQSEQAQRLVQTLAKVYAASFHFHSSVIIVDAHAANSPGIKCLKNCLSEIKTKLTQDVPQMTGFCEAVLAWLPTLRKSALSFPVVSWEAFVETIRSQINPLASEDHFRELLTQLQHMGEVVYLKSCLHPDLLVVTPPWLCGQVIGQLLSIDFVAHARITGCYTVDDFQAAFPQVDAMAMLQVLETLQLCIQCENDGELEYEFPCYNLVETLEGLWEENDPRYQDNGCYGGVRLHSPQGTLHLLHSVFPRIQVELRRTVVSYCDSDSDLYQWFRGSKLCSGLIESLITLESGDTDQAESIEIKVRGPANTGPICFFFIEEILGIIDQVLVEMCPGLAIEKHILSVEDLRGHCIAAYCFPPDKLMKAMLEETRLDTKVHNPLAGCYESLFDLIAFGSNEVRELILPADELSVGCLSTVCRQQLCTLLDPPDPHGKDWCLLTVQLGLQEKLSAIEGTDGSHTANLLDLWAAEKSSLGTLIRKLMQLGRWDAANVLLRSSPLYRIVPELSQPQETSNDYSQNLSR